MATAFPIDRVMKQVESRMKAPTTSPIDIYVWSDGRVTGPPTGNEPDEAKLVTLVTPTGGRMPDLNDIRATILKGVDVAPEEPIDVPVATTDFEEVPPQPSPDGEGG
jgi:hypothetical protein